MFPDFGRCDDVGFEVPRRAATLAQRRIGPGSVVAIPHSGSSHFFADLFAVCSVGATAARLESPDAQHKSGRNITAVAVAVGMKAPVFLPQHASVTPRRRNSAWTCPHSGSESIAAGDSQEDGETPRRFV
jgi:hypothetical protein